MKSARRGGEEVSACVREKSWIQRRDRPDGLSDPTRDPDDTKQRSGGRRKELITPAVQKLVAS